MGPARTINSNYKLRHMRYAEAIITACMRYAETFDPFVFGKKFEVRMRKGITAHARVKKGAYHLQNTKIHSSRRIIFFAEKMASR